MTVITIESNSEEATHFLVEYAKKLGFPVKTDEHRVLTDDDIAFGFGRKATDAELEEYLLKDNDEEPIDISVAFAKYVD